MTKQPEGDKSPKETPSQPGKLGIKSDTFTQVPDKESDNVKGGRAADTNNATKEDARCCGE